MLEESSKPLLSTSHRHLCIVKSFQAADFTQAQPLQVNPWSPRIQGHLAFTKVLNLSFHKGFNQYPEMCLRKLLPQSPQSFAPNKKSSNLRVPFKPAFPGDVTAWMRFNASFVPPWNMRGADDPTWKAGFPRMSVHPP